jgi:hypothetical protein
MISGTADHLLRSDPPMIAVRYSYPHVHWAVYVPPGLQRMFKQQLRKWLSDVAGEITCDSAIHVRDVYRSHGLGRYQMKGLLPQVARRYHVRSEPQGVVFGKRCGVSRSLGPTERRRYAERIASSIEPPF